MCGVFHPVLGEDILGCLGTESPMYAVLGTRQWRTSDTIQISFSWKGPSLESNLPFNDPTSSCCISCLTQKRVCNNVSRRRGHEKSDVSSWKRSCSYCARRTLVFTLRRLYYTAVINTPTCCSNGSVVVHPEVEGPEQGPGQKSCTCKVRVTATCKRERLVLPLPLYVITLVLLSELTSACCQQAKRGSDWPF